MKSYDYKLLSPLDDGEIRLLKLHWGPWNAELVANLVQRSLISPKTKRWGGQNVEIPNPEPYDALSYTWGPEWPPEKGDKGYIKILVQAEVSATEVYYIQIRPNLFSALRQMRRLSEEPLYLWIDALCINQLDRDEKSQQIQRLFNIYNGARQVRVWLGEEGNDSGEAMKFVRRCLNLDDFDRLVQDTPTSSQWAALSTLMRRPWFNRRWIVQEISLAKQAILHCGNDTLDWRDFADCVSLLYHKRQDLKRLFRESPRFGNHPDYLGNLTELGAIRLVHASDNLFYKTKEGQIERHLLSLEALISSLTAFEASDDHDIVYAVLWLAKDARPYLPPEKRLTGSYPSRASFSSRPDRVKTQPDFSPESHFSEQVMSPTTIERPFHAEPNHWPMSPVTKIKSSDELNPVVKRDTEDTGREPQSTRKRLLEAANRIKQGMHTRGNDAFRKAPATSKYSTHNQITVDYNRPIFEVCQEFLRFVIDRSHSLDILCRPWAPNNPDFPSWIPQLADSAFGISQHGVHRRVNADPLVGRPGYSTTTYQASRNSKADVGDFNTKDKSLRVKGFVLARIKERQAKATAGIIPYDWISAGGWSDTQDYPPEQFWRTLVGNRDLYNERPPTHWKRICRDAFQRRPRRGDLITSESIMYDCPSAVQEFLERVQCVVWSRRLILLEKLGSLGLAPSAARKGDEICILYGCSVPVVLRKYINGVPARKYERCDCFHKGCRCGHCSVNATLSPTGPDIDGKSTQMTGDKNKPNVHYEFIGECYVHGMMDGEAQAIKEQEFELR